MLPSLLTDFNRYAFVLDMTACLVFPLSDMKDY